MSAHPKVRSLEPVQLPTEEGQESPTFLLRDPAQLSSEQIVLTLPALALVELSDGSRNLSEIAVQMTEMTGLVVTEEQITSLLEKLDSHYLLENARARERLSQISPRPMRHSGGGYPTDPAELLPFLDDLLSANDVAQKESAPRASILPHIDFFRGHQAYRQGYRHLHALTSSVETLTVIILGISHAFSHTPFILTKKDFDTPLGVVKTDPDLVDKLATGLPFDPYQNEYNHMAEHSIEFHALLLKRLVGNKSLKIVPVLCSSFYRAIREKHSPLEIDGVDQFLSNLKKLRDEDPNLHFLASVDLAHMGLNFGGERLTPEFLAELETRDLASIEGILKGKADDFFATHQADLGERNYCGTPAIYTLLKLFPQAFELHRYQQCTDPDLGSTVTICSATLS